MSSIISFLQSAGNWFWSLYQFSYGWVWPFYLVADLFYQLSLVFYNLAGRFYEFSLWVSDVQSKIGNYLSWSTIWGYILSYVPNLTQIRDWFYAWWSNVTSVIAGWWSATSVTVQGWITAATEPFNAMRTAWDNFWQTTWPGWVISFNAMRTAWDNFWTVTFPTLVSFSWLTTWWISRLLDVQGLLNSTLRSWFPFYDDLVNIWGNIAEFFTSPLTWLVHRLEDWFWHEEES